jgi:serine/threonine protein kinase
LSGHEVTLVEKTTGHSFSIALSFFALERASQSLASYLLNRKKPVSLARRLEIAREIGKGVNRLHGRGYCHRDLKADNVLLFSGGIVKLGDLGTCRSLDGKDNYVDDYLSPVGDIRFAAPEQFFGAGNSAALHAGSDWFSVGGLLFEVVTEQHLYVAISLSNRELIQMMDRYAKLPPAQRIPEFLKVVATISGKYPLPSVRDYRHLDWLAGSSSATLATVDDLVRSLCHFDFRKRVTSFSHIMRKLDICLLHARRDETERARRLLRGESGATLGSSVSRAVVS